MKIAILTQALHNNCGGYLQNYALQQVLRNCGFEVETLDWDFYVSKYEPEKPFIYLLDTGKIFLSRTLLGRKTNYSWTRKEIYHSLTRRNRKFADENMSVSPYLWGKRQFRKYAGLKGFDAFIVGSDQVWRPAYNCRGMLGRMFLDFTDNMDVRRIAYAASFGTDIWEFSNKETKACSKLIKRFDGVSVRESSGIELCQSHFGINPVHVVDPTMLLEQSDYMKIIKNLPSPQKDKYIFSYILDNNKYSEQIIGQFCTSVSLNSYSILPKPCNLYKQKINDLDEYLYPSAVSWLNAICHSEFIVCDSFHGVVFSIIFNKPFAVFINSNRGESRFQSLLSLFGLTDRIIRNPEEDLTRLYSCRIDWDRINGILTQERTRSLDFLNCNLKFN